VAKIIKGAWMELKAPIKKTRKKSAIKHSDCIYQLKIVLKDSKPPIWRRLLVRGQTDLGTLHAILQTAMGWTDSHMHLFEIGDVTYGSSVEDQTLDDSECEDDYSLAQVAPKEKAKFTYEYDMGDGWLHTITVEKILSGDADKKLPILVAGAGECPPEDIGGLWGYYAMLDIIADPKHPEYDEMIERIPEDFDPDAFDLDGINKLLKPFQKK